MLCLVRRPPPAARRPSCRKHTLLSIVFQHIFFHFLFTFETRNFPANPQQPEKRQKILPHKTPRRHQLLFRKCVTTTPVSPVTWQPKLDQLCHAGHNLSHYTQAWGEAPLTSIHLPDRNHVNQVGCIYATVKIRRGQKTG